MYRSKILFIYIFILLTSGFAQAQKYFQMEDEQFGRSKLQSHSFDWKSIKSRNFEFVYYKGGEGHAQKAAKYSEGEFGKITDILGYTPFEPIKIFIYNSKEDLMESNIAYDEIDNSVDFSNANVQVVFQKNDSLFKHQLVNKIVNLYAFDMLYGGSFKEAVQNKILLSLPNWFTPGLAAFIAENNEQKIPIFKETIAKLKNINNLKPAEAEIVGQSIWYYISKKYGQDKISNILNLTRIIRNEQASFTSTLSVPYPKFLNNWKSYYLQNQNLASQVSKIPVAKKVEVLDESKKLKLNIGQVDTDYYVFDSVNLNKFKINNLAVNKSNDKSQTIDNSGKNETLKLSKPQAYQNYFIAEEMNMGIKFDPIRKFGLTSDLIFHDILANNVLSLSAYFKPSSPLVKNYDYSVEYANYTKKLDFKLKYTKRAIDFSGVNDTTSYFLKPLNINNLINLSQTRLVYQDISFLGMYPISKNSKIEFGADFIKAGKIDLTLPGDEVKSNNYLSPKINYVFDNTILLSENMEIGTKAKLSFERNFSISNALLNFGRLNLDVRHYQKIAKGIVLAGRFNYGKSNGNSPMTTYLGGVNNSVNRSVYNSTLLSVGEIGDLRNLLFNNYASNLRGFDFARLSGNSYILINLELRFIASKYLPASATDNTILRNLQFILFDDIGTAWRGSKGPFSNQNSLNNYSIVESNSPFFGSVTTFKNPFLMGLGAGLRTKIMGLDIRADYARGREDKHFNAAKFQLSLGSNF